MILFILLFTFVYFNPQLADAESLIEENGKEGSQTEIVEKELEEVEYIEESTEETGKTNGQDSSETETSFEENLDIQPKKQEDSLGQTTEEQSSSEQSKNQDAISEETVEGSELTEQENEIVESEEASKETAEDQELVESGNDTEDEETTGTESEEAENEATEEQRNEEMDTEKGIESETETVEDKAEDEASEESNNGLTEEEQSVEAENEAAETEGETAVDSNGKACHETIEDSVVTDSQNETNEGQEVVEEETDAAEDKEKEDVVCEEEIVDSENKVAEIDEQAEEEAKDEEKEESEEIAKEEKPKLGTFSTFSVQRAKTFQQGDRNDNIVDLKKKLNAIGFNGISVTNYYGNWTETRVRQFQEYYGLSVNGKLDTKTVNKLNKVFNSPFQEGKRHKEIPAFKKKLNKIGYDGISLTTYFGSWSDTRLRQFQGDHGLLVNGIGDSVTLALLNVLAGEASFQQGDRHQYMEDLKEQLNHVSFDNITVTDYYGNWTETRVEQFQEYYGLPVNGQLDAQTINKLDEVYNSPYQEGKRHEDIPAFKEKLNKIGYDGISLTTYFGNWSDTRLSQFQEDHGLRVNGIGDSITLKVLNVLAGEDSFQQGDRHQYMEDLKEQLNHVSFDNITVTDYYGNWTETRVEQFQEYYGLPVNGQLDAQTIDKLDEVYNSPFQEGKRHEDIPAFKEKLNKTGYDGISLTTYFGNWSDTRLRQFQEDHGLRVNGIGDSVTLTLLNVLANEDSFQKGDRHQYLIDLKEQLNRVGFDNITVTNYYGNWTKTRVKQFQDYYGLPVNGKLTAETIDKLDEVYNSPFQKGKRHKDIPALKEKLNALGYDGISVTTYFGNWTDTRLRQFQEDHGLRVNGIGDTKTLAALESLAIAITTTNYTDYDLTLAEALAMQMQANPQTDQHYAYVSKSYINGNNKVTASALNVRTGPCACDSKVGKLQKGDKVNILGEYKGWYKIEFNSNTWKDAAPEDVLYYLDPTNFVNDDKLIFQFLDLSKPSNTTASVLNNYLDGKGILEGQGQAFIDASEKNGISDFYLLSHALLETGNGGSELATGVKVNGKTVYNMYGIGANDGCALECGAQKAYDEGWFTPYDAIVGGAQFIGNSYIKAGQNTLYEMRWNPAGMDRYGYATHQYATDIGWATKQLTSMYNIAQTLGVYNLILDIPKYKS